MACRRSRDRMKHYPVKFCIFDCCVRNNIAFVGGGYEVVRDNIASPAEFVIPVGWSVNQSLYNI